MANSSVEDGQVCIGLYEPYVKMKPTWIYRVVIIIQNNKMFDDKHMFSIFYLYKY